MDNQSQFPILNLPLDIQESLILPLIIAEVGAAAIRSTCKKFRNSFDQQLTCLVIGRHGGHQGDRAVPFCASILYNLVHRTIRTPKLRCLRIRGRAISQSPHSWSLGPIPLSMTLQTLEISGVGLVKPMQALQCLISLCPNIKSLTLNDSPGSGFNNLLKWLFFPTALH